MKNLVIGTKVKLTIPIFRGSYRSAKYVKSCEVIALVVNENYGANNKHWFTFKILESEHTEFPVSSLKKMQGKNAYKNSEILEQPSNEKELTANKQARKELNLIICQYS